MREAGVNLVSVGVFSWALLEPAEGKYEFGWLDRVLDLLHGGGIAVDLATATASPPPWFSARLPGDAAGRPPTGGRLWPGSRQAYCPSSPRYRPAATALAEQLATRYADHPALAMWHINNEYGCHVARCYCDVSADGVPALAAGRATATWTRSTPPGAPRSGASATTTGTRSSRRAATPSFAQPHPGPGLPPVQLGRAARLLPGRARGAPPDHPRQARDHELHAAGSFDGLDYQRPGLAEQDLVSNDHYLIGEGPGQRTLDLVARRRPDPLARPRRAVAADGALHVARSTGSPGTWPRRPGSSAATAWRTWPVARTARCSSSGAPSARGCGEVPLGDGAARRHRHEDLARGGRARRRPARARRGRRQPGRGATSRSSGLPRAAGRRTPGGPAQRGRRLLGRGPRAGTAPCGAPGSPRTSCTRPTTSPGTALVFVPALYLVSDVGAANLTHVRRERRHAGVGCYSGIVDEHDHVRLGGYPGAFREPARRPGGGVLPAGRGRHGDAVDGGTGPGLVGAARSTGRRGGRQLCRRRYWTAARRWPGTPGAPARPGTSAPDWTTPTRAPLLARICAEAGVTGRCETPPGVEAVRRRHATGAVVPFPAQPR